MFQNDNDRSSGMPGRVRNSLLVAMVLAMVAGIAAAVDGSAPGALSDVRIERAGDATLVTLVGVRAEGIASREESAPRRLVIELPGVRAERLADQVSVREGGIEQIAIASTSDAMGAAGTRVELGLADGARYDVASRDGGLEIAVRTDVANAAQGGTAAAIPTRAAATRLLAVEPKTGPDGTTLLLRADGTIEGAKSFTLDHPARLVVDLAGVRNAVPAPRIDVGSADVARVRVAQHDDRTRVVIDAGSAERPFEGREIVSAEQGLVVALGAGASTLAATAAGTTATATGEPATVAVAVESREEAASAASPVDVAALFSVSDMTTADFEVPNRAPIDDPMAVGNQIATLAETPAAVPITMPAVSAEPVVTPEVSAGGSVAAVEAVTPAPGRVLRGIELDAQASRDRLVLVSDDPIDFELTEPTSDTVVIRVHGTTIDPAAQLRITPDSPGVIEGVSAFEQPGETPEARVLVQRSKGAKAEVVQRGSIVIIDFARGAKAAEQASALPLLTAAEMQVASGKSIGSTEPAALGGSGAKAAAGAKGAGGESGILREGGLVAGKQYTGRRISLDLKSVEIDDVLRLIAEVSDLNVIAGDDVVGKVTIRLVDVPWDQALDVILLTKGLGFVRVGSVLRIAPANMLQQEEEARLQEKRAKEKLEDLEVRLVPVNYASVDEVEKLVKRLLTARGVVNIDKRTSTLILKDIPGVIREATSLVQAIDSQTPQVLIEAKVVEANLDFSRELGTEWALGSNPEDGDGDTQGDLSVAGTEYITSGASTWPFQTANNIVSSNPITSVANGLLNLSGFVLDERFNVALQLQAAESTGEGKVISSPRIVTLDNREAKIEQGVSIPFQTFENGDAQLEFIDAVLSLKVTPHITSDRSIIMKIEVTKNAPDDSVDTPTGSPAIAKNQAKTETLVKNGQTLVLGGIYVVDQSDNESRIPYLHSIPLVGWAFKSHEVRDRRKELLLFVTPRIVESTLPKVAAAPKAG